MKIKYKIICYIFLYLIGFIFWYKFLGLGQPFIAVNDWVNSNLHLDTVRLGINHAEIPWSPSIAYGNNKYFLANPEVVTTPDIILLKIINNSTYIYLHIMLLYSIGFYSLLKISDKYSLSNYSFILLYVLFNYNGYIISHLSMGHFIWTGYFLLPLFIYYLNNFLVSRSQIYIILNSFLMGFLYLNGSFHIAIFLCMFLIFSAMWEIKNLFPFLKIIILSGLIGFSKILPALIFFKHDGRLEIGSKFRFITGYPDLSTLLDAFLVQKDHSYMLNVISGELYWHEYSMYVGVLPFIGLLVGVFYAIKKSDHILSAPIIFGGCAILLMSFENTYSIIANAPLPFVGIERISTRFIVIPFLIFLIYGIIGFDSLIKDIKVNKYVLFSGLIFISGNVYTNLVPWRISTYKNSNEINNSALFLLENNNLYYSSIVCFSWFITIISIVYCLKNFQKLIKNKDF
jgi:hypothetical protein